MGIETHWGFTVGSLPHGPRNLISDVPGVTVGHCTLADGDVQTGVTALLPHPGDTFHEKVPAAAHVINGFGKTTGLVQIQELGTLETPILFTNTLSVGTVSTALVRYMLDRCPDICETTGSVNPVVCECNDSGLDDIRGLHVTEAHALAALADCRADFAEGAVGAGRGMRCHGPRPQGRHRLGLPGGGAGRKELLPGGAGPLQPRPVRRPDPGRRAHPGAAGRSPAQDRAPPGPRLHHHGAGHRHPPHLPAAGPGGPAGHRGAEPHLSRTGSYCGNGSGEIVIAFSTGCRIPHYPQGDLLPLQAIHEDRIDRLFRAAAECVEESVLSSLLHAETVTGRGGLTVRGLPDLLKGEC